MGTAPQAMSVVRAMTILEFLGESQRRWNISELSRKLGIPKSTTHILIVTLERLGYVSREGTGRDITTAVRFYGSRPGANPRQALSQRAENHMTRLVAQTGLTTHLAVLDEGQALYIQKVAGDGPVQFDTYIGKRSNLHCTAVGKVILAYSSPETVESFLTKTGLARHTRNTIASGSDLRKELARVRKDGYALDDQEEELEVRCLAVPVFDFAHRFVASIGLCGTVSQIHSSNIPALAGEGENASWKITSSRQ